MAYPEQWIAADMWPWLRRIFERIDYERTSWLMRKTLESQLQSYCAKLPRKTGASYDATMTATPIPREILDSINQVNYPAISDDEQRSIRHYLEENLPVLVSMRP